MVVGCVHVLVCLLKQASELLGLAKEQSEAPGWSPSFKDTGEFISWNPQGVQGQGGRSTGLVLLIGQNQPPAGWTLLGPGHSASPLWTAF